DAHAIDPRLHKVLVEQVPRVGRLEHVHAIEDEVLALARAYLEAHAEELALVDVEVAAFVVVHAIEALTHRAVLMRPDLLARPASARDAAARRANAAATTARISSMCRSMSAATSASLLGKY
ncbi:MAG TPA: hypothetical protein VHB21_24350, partial [Minicystis sp.]|nr:hypothetical protein [Minicystis sp.]